MSDIQQVLLLLLCGLPYIAIALFLVISRKANQFRMSDVFLGFFGIAVGLGLGIVGAVLIITAYPQTNATISNSFLGTVLAVMLGVALLGGEFFRYISLKPSKDQQSRTSLSGLAFGVGFSLGEFVFFVAIVLMNWGKFLTMDAALMILVDVIIQLAISIAAYELIKNENAASILVGTPYFLSLFLTYALHGSVILNVTQKVIFLIIALMLAFTFMPKNSATD